MNRGRGSMSFSEAVKEIRYTCLMSQETFAHHLGVAFSAVNRWENGKTLPSLHTLGTILQFCENYNIDRDAVFNSWKEDKDKKNR